MTVTLKAKALEAFVADIFASAGCSTEEGGRIERQHGAKRALQLNELVAGSAPLPWRIILRVSRLDERHFSAGYSARSGALPAKKT